MFRLTRMKLDRAKQRMKELEEALQSFYATNPFKFSGKADLQAGKVVYTMDSVKDAPDEASLIAGEIIQNLRSALDHLAYQLFLRGGGTGAGKNIYFPIGGSKTSYENKKSTGLAPRAQGPPPPGGTPRESATERLLGLVIPGRGENSRQGKARQPLSVDLHFLYEISHLANVFVQE